LGAAAGCGGVAVQAGGVAVVLPAAVRVGGRVVPGWLWAGADEELVEGAPGVAEGAVVVFG
jgi:hypothetical protein